MVKTSSELSPAIEDYLRAIYKLSRRNPAGENVTTTQLAEKLNLRPASITVMLQRLAATDPPLLNYHKHQGVSLTPAGELAAISVVRHHRLLEQYLHEKLGYGWDEVHEEADRLEHSISDLLAARMSAALGNPTHDPHGHAIPGENLTLSSATYLTLDRLPCGDPATIQSVRDEDPEILRYLDQVGLRPGTQVRVLALHPLNETLTLAIGTQLNEVTIDTHIANQILVLENGN